MEGNTLYVEVLSAFCDLQLFFGVPASSIVREMMFLSFEPLKIYIMSALMLYCPFPRLPRAGERARNHIQGPLFAISPDMSQFLAFSTLRETNLGFIRPYQYLNMTKNVFWDS
jgi:hypothetical protein